MSTRSSPPTKGVPIWQFCRYADTPILVIADMPILPIFSRFRSTEKGVDSDAKILTDMAQNADIQISAISALKMLADSRYADIEKKCRYLYRHTLSAKHDFLML